MHSLTHWYRHINGTYIDRNFYRSIESVFAHLVEVSRGLCVAASTRRKRDLDPEQFLPKSLAWWLALCGRAGVPDIEQMLWAKFPRLCPYCQRPAHDGRFCKESDPAKKLIDWQALARQSEGKERPKDLRGWQQMFNDIYPRSDGTDHETNVNRLSEELGELAEAVRVLPVAPQYFLAEAPDVFAWLMGFANQFDYDHQRFGDYGGALSRAMAAEYPGHCLLCGRSVCKCPPIPSETLGRIAKEAPLEVLRLSRLFNLQESLTYFGRSEQELVIGAQHIKVTPDELELLRQDTAQILDVLRRQSAGDHRVKLELAAALGGIRYLTAQGDITQAAVEDLLQTIRGLPTESRQHLLGFVNNVAASGTFFALGQVVTHLLGP